MTPHNAPWRFRYPFPWPPSIANAFPLLSRELIEQSARKRTYILRTIYATAVYGFVLMAFWSELGSWSSQSFSFLGRGRQLFQALAWLQFLGVYLFLPAMTCSVLTVEKERDTLALLLLTRLGPWSILIGKLFSRLIPMASFLLLSLPLVAVSYSLGGVETREIVSLAWSLTATSLQIGALALACSAWCRTTAAAFLTTYLLGASFIIGPIVLFEMAGVELRGLFYFMGEIGRGVGLVEHPEDVGLVLFGPWLCLHPTTQGSPWIATVVRSLPILMFAGACLLFARTVIWKRAFVPPSNALLKLFRSLDKLFHRLNQNRLTRGIVLTREDVALPEYEPIRWRETKKRSLGTTRYLVRLLIVLEIPVLFGLVVPSGFNRRSFDPIAVTESVLWSVAVLIIAIQSTGLIGLEKSRQTLDVLLAIPLDSRTIVREKFTGLWRMIRMLWIPFGTVYTFEIWWSTTVGRFVNPEGIAFELFTGVCATAIYLPLVAWLGFYAGMRCRSQTQAVLVTLSLIAGLCAIPVVLMNLLDFDLSMTGAWLSGCMLLSPAMVISATYEFGNGSWYGSRGEWLDFSWVGAIAHFLIFGTWLSWLRWRSLKMFPVYVGRNDGLATEFDTWRSPPDDRSTVHDGISDSALPPPTIPDQ